MTAPERTPPPTAGPTTSGRSDRSGWNWLLIIPVALPLLPFIYNSDEPRLFGFPLFYWLQLAFIGVGVAATSVVYLMTKKKGGES
ncbi:hypothetical protein Afil01_65740 [Actinorhabdospora filicis]|uniref:DUF3311 domain-containing protein n=1 Tax=Actinorhabdospora filicis TaxID=1785913 RepID=A0A9W6STX3_9ACTN|nr:DUF3311 domain-containing protein [Actinorhabdospora filicis]GLZ81767.1 hypothetical protein Afil01_65740 [Actinorhabdospora filicis]